MPLRIARSSLIALLSSGLLAAGAGAGTFQVDDPGDDPDANPGDGVFATALATCALRTAAEETAALPGPLGIPIPGDSRDRDLLGEADGPIEDVGSGEEHDLGSSAR